jgi:putative spermidine/putrescine transport system ATP-binding protein
MRPEVLGLGRSGEDDLVLSGRIEEVHFLGSVIRIQASVAGRRIMLDTFNQPGSPPPAPGSVAEFGVNSSHLLVLEG